jgi:hypothetical protein
MEVIADALVSVSTGPVVSVTVIDVDCGEAVSVVCAFPVVSVIENELAAAIVAVAVSPTKVAVEIAVIVQTVGDVWTIPDNEVIPVKVKSVPLVVERVEQAIGSLPVTVKVTVPEPLVAAVAARVTVGAVVSIVTDVDCGEPVRVVCALPAVSVIENVLAAVRVDVTAPPPFVALEVAVIVQTVPEV